MGVQSFVILFEITKGSINYIPTNHRKTCAIFKEMQQRSSKGSEEEGCELINVGVNIKHVIRL